MGQLDKINLGIVGIAGRGGSFRRSIEALGAFRLHALCDINEQGLAEKAAEMDIPAERTFTDHQQMFEKGGIDAVIIGTPMPLHVPQAIAALDRDIHVLSEVPAGVNVDECRDLVAAAVASRATYMMAENYIYIRDNQVIGEMVRRGEFGTPYYAEGEYLHELKGLNEITRWRRKWQTGINGITYGTHSLGPILQWFPGDRVVSVCCAGSGHHYRDPRGDHYEAEDCSVMLGKMGGGGLVKVRVDMLSDRPHAMNNYQLQGTDGCYESTRVRGGKSNIWLRSRSPEPKDWEDLQAIWDDYTPEPWRRYAEQAKTAGHGGGDLLELVDFLDAIRGERPPALGIHEAMDMTLPGLISQQSIEQGGQWLDVPDSRAWAAEISEGEGVPSR